MSDTPRTDDRIVVVTILQSHPKMEMVNAPFVRPLERELNAEKQHIAELEGRLRVLWDKLEGERKYYQDRIKRLEEAGDEVVINYVNSLSAFEIWRKAKEAKP